MLGSVMYVNTNRIVRKQKIARIKYKHNSVNKRYLNTPVLEEYMTSKPATSIEICVSSAAVLEYKS